MHELIQLCQTDPVTVFIIVGIIGATVVGALKYIAYMVKGDASILKNDDE